MKYIYVDKKSEDTIILFHGTGGDESDLIFIAERINPQANIIGLRGRINEHGLNRFFKRLSPGIFDTNNLIEETKYIHGFLKELLIDRKINSENVTLLGFSNGANMIASLLFHYGKAYGKYILMHPMIPMRDFDIKEQQKNNILITAGDNDPIVTLDEAAELSNLLMMKNAEVLLKVYHYGHQISEEELRDIKLWYEKLE